MMDKRTVMKMALEWRTPPYVPWNINFTIPSMEKLQQHYVGIDLEEFVQNHIVNVGYDTYFAHEVGDECVQDSFGVIWDLSIDKDIGVVKGQVLTQPTLHGYTFPDPVAPYIFDHIDDKISKYRDRFRVFGIGFSLYERAWALRGLQTLLTDFYDNPQFVHRLLNAIADYKSPRLRSLKYDIDGVMFGDDWGQQHGLKWDLNCGTLLPVLAKMYVVTAAGKK
jgi:uroporphyrinogen decarboxylase